MAKCVRALLLHLHYHLRATRPIQVAHTHQRYSGCHRMDPVYGLRLFTARPFAASGQVDGHYGFPEWKAALKRAGTRKDRIER